MEWLNFVRLSDADIAIQLHAAQAPCWAIASGGTRRAYLAQGGRLAHPSDLSDYFGWLERAQRAMFNQLFDLGVTTIIATEHVPLDRGPDYIALARSAIQAVVNGPDRQHWYTTRRLRVIVAGDVEQLAGLLATPEIADDWQHLAVTTARADGPTLVYLFRGDWIDVATEEAAWGYRLGLKLGHEPAREDLVRAFYGTVLPRLTIYLGSGRPHLRHLRPPFITGHEDCYWSAGPLLRLSPAGVRRIIYDHLWHRPTIGNRSYGD